MSTRHTVALFALAALGALASTSSADATSGGWVYTETVDPVTDARRGFATLGGDDTGAVIIKCDKNGPGSVYIMAIPPGAYLGPSSGDRKVIVRFDDEPAREDNWRYSSDYISKASQQVIDSVFRGRTPSWDMGATVNELAPSFSRARKIVLRAYDYREVPSDIVLSSDGNGDPVRRVYATCGDAWPEP